jgi:hypothetical protein
VSLSNFCTDFEVPFYALLYVNKLEINHILYSEVLSIGGSSTPLPLRTGHFRATEPATRIKKKSISGTGKFNFYLIL